MINPVEAREAEMTLPQSLKPEYEIPQEVETVEGFTNLTEAELAEFIKTRGLAMDTADLWNAGSTSARKTASRRLRKSG